MQSTQVKIEVTHPDAIASFITTGTMMEPGQQHRSIHTFDLLHQPLDLGVCQFEQWWIERNKLYPTRNRPAPMYTRIMEAFWDLCRAASTDGDPEIQESYLLAMLLPHIRDQGAGTVFRDSVPHRRSARSRKADSADELEQLLSHSEQPTKVEAFHRFTSDTLGPPSYAQAVRDCYDEMVEHLLAPGRQKLGDADHHAAVSGVTQRWLKWKSTIGRHSGKDDMKRVLDVLSYESKAAFHRAYSAVWKKLIPVLERNHGLDTIGARFHRFWQLDQTQVSVEYPNHYAHLFHGHIFGLHPASATFMQTPTGRRLTGDWLLDDSQANYERLICGLMVACSHYTDVYEQIQLDRSTHPMSHYSIA